MSAENVERFRQATAAWNRRDLEGHLDFFDFEVEWSPGFTRVEGGVYRGREGIRQFWADVDSGFDEPVPDFDEVRDLGDTVVGLGRLRGRSNEGVPIDTQYGVVVRFREGLAVSGSDWFSHADALEAAGLPE